MDECYLMIWDNNKSHYWYKKIPNRQMAEAYMNISKMYLADNQYRYVIKPELVKFISVGNIDSIYDHELLNYICENFERKIYERFRENVINKLSES